MKAGIAWGAGCICWFIFTCLVTFFILLIGETKPMVCTPCKEGNHCRDAQRCACQCRPPKPTS